MYKRQVDQQNTKLKETIKQQLKGVNDKLDQQKAEVELILQNYDDIQKNLDMPLFYVVLNLD